MSYELEIATHLKPQRKDIAEALPEAAKLSGVFDGDGNLIVECRSWSCVIDGPFRCQPDDLDEALAHAVVAPAWLIQMHVPIGDPKVARKSAARIATNVARARRGAVYDPQLERVIFPRGGKRPTPPRLAVQLTRDLKCEWCYAPEVLASTVEQFLSVADRFLPEAIPVRFGTFEPLQHRFEEGRSGFVQMWGSESSTSGSFFWTCRKPGLGGGVNWPFDNEANAKRGGVAAAHMYVELEGDILTTDAQWRAAVTAFFRAVSSRTEAFFGRAILSPSGPRPVSASEIENLFVPSAVFRGRWHGLPRHPAWLTWLGQDYSAAFARNQGLASTTSQATGHLFVQDENLDAASERLPEGVSEALYRVPLQGQGGGSRERLARGVSFVDARWLP